MDQPVETKDVYTKLLSFIAPESIKLMSETNTNLGNFIHEIEKNNSYWIQRIEHQFDLIIPEKYYSTLWKEACEILESGKTVRDEDGYVYYIDYNQYIKGYGVKVKAPYVKLALSLSNYRTYPNFRGSIALISASHKRLFDVVKVLLEDSRVDPSAESSHALKHAAMKNSFEIVELLLQDPRVNPSTEYNQPFLLTNDVRIMKLLIQDKRFNPSDGNRAILQSAISGLTEQIRLLLQDGRVDPSVENNQAIIDASKHGNLEVVKLLLQDRRVNPSAQDNKALRDTVGFYAWYSSEIRLEIVKLLLQDKRVDPSCRNNEAIKIAASKNRWDIVELLLSDERVLSTLPKIYIYEYMKNIPNIR
jgi:ankyrin repeat protein